MKLVMRIKSLFARVIRTVLKIVAPPEFYARFIGVNIGRNCFISTKNWSTEPYLITIGNNVQITQGVCFHTHGGGHVLRKEYKDFDAFGKVNVEDWCYIGAFSQIMPGVTIGEGSLVAAGSIVTKSVPPYTVVGGNPARYICSVEEYKSRNLKFNLNIKSLSNEEKRKLLISLSSDLFIVK